MVWTSFLDERSFEILKYLVAHPTSSMAEVASNLHYRAETVSSHIQSMQERDVYETTMALLSYKKLDMAYVPVNVRAPLANLEDIYKTCRAHPYIQYSVRTLGATDGAFLVFTVPQRAVPLLTEFLDELAACGTITDHRMYVTDDTNRDFMKADMALYDPPRGEWNFDWSKWQSDGNGETATDGGQKVEQLTVQPELSKLEKTDLEILHMTSTDAKQPTDEIAKAVELAPHVVRRRIQFLEEEGFIIGYRAMVAYSKFHLASTMLFNCNAPQPQIKTCKQKLLSLPFPGTFIPVQNGFLCQATLPPEGLPPVHRFLSKYCSSVEVSWFDLSTSDVASLNSAAFSDGAWRTESSFMIDEPLRTIGRKHGKIVA